AAGAVVGGFVEPVDLVHLANDHELVAIGADRAVVVEAIGKLDVAADHVGGLHHHPGHRVVHAAALPRDLRADGIHRLFLGVIHDRRARHDALGDDRPRGVGPVHVEGLDPVVVLDAAAPGVHLLDPDRGTAAVDALHDEVFGVGGVYAPLLVRREDVELDLRIAVRQLAEHLLDGAGVDGRAPGDETLAEGQHPLVIHIELLASGQRPPGDQLVHVGVAGVVADLLALQARPGGRGDDLARLGDDVAKADLLLFLALSQVQVVATGYLREGVPGLEGDLAVGFRGQHQDGFTGLDVAFDARASGGGPLGDHPVQPAQQLDFPLRVPGEAFAAVAQPLQFGAQRGEA